MSPYAGLCSDQVSGRSRIIRCHLAALAVICFCAFFYRLGTTETGLMEARNFVTAREMVEYHNWLVPTMNGAIRIAKPPLPTWLAALSSLAAGTSDPDVLRLPSAFSAALMVLFIYGLARTICRKRHFPFLAAAILATSIPMIRSGRTGSWDIFCHSFMLAALWAMIYGMKKQRGIRPFIPAGICLGLSFMSKGPVAFYAMLLPCMLSYVMTYGGKQLKEQWPGLLTAAAIFLLISCWWPVYLYMQHPDMLAAVAKMESGSWGNRHVKPLWYYWHFPVFMGVWLFAAIGALIRPYAVKKFHRASDYKFFLLWLVITIVLLSLLPEKKERYLLPAMVPMALLAGALLDGLAAVFNERRQRGDDKLLVAVHAWFWGFVAILAPAAVWYYGERGIAFILSAIVFWGISGAIYLYYRQGRIYHLTYAGIILVCALLINGMRLYPVITYRNPDYSTLNGSPALNFLRGINVYGLGHNITMTMIWDLGRRLKNFQLDEVERDLKSGPVGLLSNGDPLLLLPEELKSRVTLQRLGVFDYHKKRPGDKVYLSTIRLTGPADNGS